MRGEYEVAAQHFHAVLEAEAIPSHSCSPRALSQSDKAAEALDCFLASISKGVRNRRGSAWYRAFDRLGREELAIEAVEQCWKPARITTCA